MIKRRAFDGVIDILKGRRWDIFCDYCERKADQSDVFKSTKGNLFLSSTGGYHAVCNACFGNGFRTIKREVLEGRDFGECACCRKELRLQEESINEAVKFVCPDCIKSKGHPANSHSFFGRDEWKHCEQCRAVAVFTEGSERYWTLGTKEFSKYPAYQCGPIDTTDLEQRCAGNHTFITVVDLTKNRLEVERIKKYEVERLKNLLSPPGREEVFPLNKYDLAFARCGYKVNWCVRCGYIKRELPNWWPEVL
jgi:hypothetical protein